MAGEEGKGYDHHGTSSNEQVRSMHGQSEQLVNIADREILHPGLEWRTEL